MFLSKAGARFARNRQPMPLDSRVSLRHVGTFVLGLVLALAAGCSKEPTRVSERFGSAPQTELTYAPLDLDTTSFRVHLYWNGYDNDGEVTRYHFAVDADSLAPLVNWKTTTATDTTLQFSVDPISALHVHAFKIAAEDNDGRIDPTPASRTFSARTAPPISTIQRGPEAFNPIVPSTFTFGWSGTDPDGGPTGGQAPVDSFQYMLLRVGALADSSDSLTHDPLPRFRQADYLAMIRAAVGDGLPAAWTSPDGITRRLDDWKWIGIRGLGRRFTNVRPGEYVFALRAVDGLGAREKDLIWVRNLRLFTVSDGSSSQPAGPLLIVSSSITPGPFDAAQGAYDFPRPPLQDFEGESISFSWTASAESYGGVITGYAYELEDSTSFPPAELGLMGVTLAPSQLTAGSHVLFVRAFDDQGEATTMTLRILIIRPSFKDPGAPRAILFVDDSAMGPLGNQSGPTDQTETDWWTLGPGGTGPLFSLGVPYTEWDTTERGLGGVEGRKQPTLGDLASFSTVVWTTDPLNGGSFQTALFKTVAGGNQSELQSYLRAGGTLILTGWNLAQNTSGTGNLTFKTGGPAPNGICATFATGSREYEETIFPRMYMGIDNSLPNTAGLRSQGAFDFVRGVPTAAGTAFGFDTARVDTGNFSYGVQYPSSDPTATTFKWNTHEFPPPAFPDQQLYPGVAGIEAWIMARDFGCQPSQNFGLEDPGQPIVQPIYSYHGVPKGPLMDGAPSPREGFPCASLVQSHDLGTNSGKYVPTRAIGRIALFTFPLYFLKDADAVDIMKKAFAYVNASPTLP
jgi:hypothetical protein